MTDRTFTAALLVACGLTLAACGTLRAGPDYARPASATEVKLTVPQGSASAPQQAWWRGLQDPVLDGYVAEAQAHNQDLALATARITEAQAALGVSHASLWPALDLTVAANRRLPSTQAPGVQPGPAAINNDRQIGLTASYEVDLWGKLARADEAAKARLLAQTANRAAVLTALEANVVQTYVALRASDVQTELAERAYATRQENLQLQKRRFDAGLIGQIEWHQFELETAASQATLASVKQSRGNLESALALLLGRSPKDIAQPQVARGADLATLFARQTLPEALPSEVLLRRPDVQSAEQNLIAANADIGQARAAYFPRLSLTATRGQEAKSLSDLFSPGAMFWTALANLAQPIFRAGAIDSLVAAANARQQQALAQYTQAVQSAFRDAHDALQSLSTNRELTDAATRRADALRDALKLVELRYRSGYSAWADVLNAQRDLAQADGALAEAQRNQLQGFVGFHRMLGAQRGEGL